MQVLCWLITKRLRPFVILAPLALLPVALAKDYSGFSSLSEAQRSSIIWKLKDTHTWGSPDQKPICRDILTKQGHYLWTRPSGYDANYVMYTLDAIELAEKQQWTDLAPLVQHIYERPISIAAYERAFRYLRRRQSKPVPPVIMTAKETLLRSSWYRSKVTDAEVKQAKEELIKQPDKEAVLVYALQIAQSPPGKGGNGRAWNAAIDVLKSLEGKATRNRIRQLLQDIPEDTFNLSAVAESLQIKPPSKRR